MVILEVIVKVENKTDTFFKSTALLICSIETSQSRKQGRENKTKKNGRYSFYFNRQEKSLDTYSHCYTSGNSKLNC